MYINNPQSRPSICRQSQPLFESLERRQLASATPFQIYRGLLDERTAARPAVHVTATAHKSLTHRVSAKAASRSANVAGSSVSTGAATASAPAPQIPGSWTSIYDEEFNGTTLDPEWETHQYWDNATTVVGQGELEAYNASAVNVSGGTLQLNATPSTAAEQAAYGTSYMSGLVETGGEPGDPAQGAFSFTHGYMEVRAQIPQGQGLWPAIWLMPANHNNDPKGELDVMENLGGDPATDYMTLHRNGKQVQFTTDTLTPGFHTFGVDWEATSVKWYLDGQLVATNTNTSMIYNKAMYPILNLAVGGDWGGDPDATTTFPASMLVDYVRVYQNENPICSPLTPTTPAVPAVSATFSETGIANSSSNTADELLAMAVA